MVVQARRTVVETEHGQERKAMNPVPPFPNIMASELLFSSWFDVFG